MLRPIFKCVTQTPKKRSFSTSSVGLQRVAVIGAAGGVGRILSMLLKAEPMVTDLALMDIKTTAGIAADVSHIDTFSGAMSYTGAESMEEALRCSNIVVVVAGATRSKDTTHEALFDSNKDLIYEVSSLKAKICPEAFLGILTNPVNSLVPMAAEALKNANAYDGKKLFGICKTDIIRSRAFLGQYMVIDPHKVTVDVCGGHSDKTLVPLLSKCSPTLKGDPDDWVKIYDRIRGGSAAVIKANEGKTSAQLCVAYATASFCKSLLRALEGKSGVFDTAYVESPVHPDAKFFISKVNINRGGITKYHDLPDLSDIEKKLLEEALPVLKADIDRGIKYGQSKKDKK